MKSRPQPTDRADFPHPAPKNCWIYHNFVRGFAVAERKSSYIKGLYFRIP